MKNFTFTVDDNIRVFMEIERSRPKSIFDHPYLAMYKRLHEKYDLKIQLNLFYECKGFTLSDFTSDYREEWKRESDWLKLSFHSRIENVNPYEFSGYEEVYDDCKRVNDEIIRFASEDSLAKTTTIHYCLATEEGVSAIKDNGIVGLLGLYGKHQNPSVSYSRSEGEVERIVEGETVITDGVAYAAIDIVLNCHKKEKILSMLDSLYSRNLIKVMIHEQYFYSDQRYYQSDFEEKISAAFASLKGNGYDSVFFEEVI